MKNWDAVQSTLREVVAVYDRLRRPENPATLAAMNSLGMVLRSSGHAPDALALFQEVDTRRLKTQGPDHPDTLTALNNVAGAYTFFRTDKAIPL